MTPKDFDTAMDELDHSYKTLRTYLKRARELSTIIANNDDNHDESIALINQALDATLNKVAKYHDRTETFIEILTDEENLNDIS